VGAFDDETSEFTVGTRAFAQPLPDEFAIDEPGFRAIGSSTGTLPPGSNALPGSADLFWDFLPMKVGAVTSNLLYWNAAAAPATVAFGATSTGDYSMTLFTELFESAAADGTGRLIPGARIGTTAADGMLHEHGIFFLDNDHDGNNATAAAPGVYLATLRLRTPPLNRSAPFYVVWGTPGTTGPSLALLETARSWVQSRTDLLAPDFSADFDGDLDVDGADFLTWQRNVGKATGALQIQGDANQDGAINATDLTLVRAQFGSSLATFPGVPSVPASTGVPEPAEVQLLLIAAAAGAAWRSIAPRNWPRSLLGSLGSWTGPRGSAGT